MQVSVIHQSYRRPSALHLHAWEPGGRVWDVDAQPDADGLFRFALEGEVADPRTVAFKFRYSEGAGTRWEGDEFVRNVPLRDAAQTVWTFDDTARCLREDPDAAAPVPGAVVVHVLTRSRFAGGRVYVWEPGGSNREYFDEAGRDDEAGRSVFRLTVSQWMRGGFHFKLMNGDDWEPERSNRVWRPADGGEVWIKSGQISMRREPFGLEEVTVELIHPRALQTPPALHLRDLVEPHAESVEVASTIDLDGDLRLTKYTARVYPNALYSLGTDDRRGFSSPLRIWLDDALPRPALVGVLGNQGLKGARPSRDARVDFVVAPNPNTAFSGPIRLNVHLGPAPERPGPGAWPPYTSVTAALQPDGTWRADFKALGGVAQSVEIAPQGGLSESRPDGPVQLRRDFSPEPGSETTYHTADGVAGLSRQAPPSFRDVSPADRARLMRATFGAAAVAAGVFAPWEMPHGAVSAGDGVWFTLKAPHAAGAELVLSSGAGAVQVHPLSLTNDLRYWWCRVPAAEAPHGTLYRFRLDGPDGIEVLDPASRWARDTGGLVVRGDDRSDRNATGPWSKVLDARLVEAAFDGEQWRTPGWESLLVYELHPLRFTRRNAGADGPLRALDQLTEELKPGGYLRRLPATALEVMPVHEFPSEQSWGYNPSLFFAVDSFYGGPEAFARFVRAAHEAGKAVLLDLVYNHMTDSPLQQVARDVYVDGETAWGDMQNYDHPAAVEFFRQATLHMWHTFRLDGFRFDATEAIVNGHKENPYIIKHDDDGWHTGSGGGWEFLRALREALRRAADAAGRPWPYLAGENDPNNWGMSDGQSGVLDGQWHFAHHYPLAEAAKNAEDKAGEIAGWMSYPDAAHESVRFGESHDSVSSQGGKERIARRAPFGQGLRMAKAVGAAALLSKGVPMLFMGAEAGEDLPFAFDLDALDEPSRFLRLDDYESGGSRNRVLNWFRDLMGLRNDSAKGLRGTDDQQVWTGRRTVAWGRAGGRLFVVATFGTPDEQQNVGWLGLPSGFSYKEIFNSSWPAYAVESEEEFSNGGYDASIRSGDVIRLPYVGAVVLERR